MTTALQGRQKVVERMANSLMARHGLLAAGWKFEFGRSRSTAGLCVFHRVAGIIRISIHLIEHNSIEAIRDTILHEIAHALVGHEHGHDEVWKAKCREVGAKPERLADVVLPRRWAAICPSCQRSTFRQRKPKGNWHCRPCGPIKGSLVWRDTQAAE